jgi:hypothetical protein
VLCGAGEVGMLPYKDGIIEDYSSSFFFTNNYNISAKEMSEDGLEITISFAKKRAETQMRKFTKNE